MIKTQKRRCIAPSIAVAMVLFIFNCGAFAEGLGPMAGTGGVMRDAERRALTAAPEGEPRDIPSVAPSASRIPAARNKVLGQIEAISVIGATEFAERDDIHIRQDIEKLLIDGTEKTVADVIAALVKVRTGVTEKGYYLLHVTASPTPVKAYDPATKTLTVRVECGGFGMKTLTFKAYNSLDGTNVEESVEEGTWFSRAQILKRFRKVQEGDDFNYSILRSALFDANAHPDLTIDTDIKVRNGAGEGDRYAYADIGFEVRESIPLHAVFEINNYGMEEVEEWQASLTLQYLNLTKHDDVLTISPQMSFGGELKSLAGSYMLPHTYWNGGNTTVYGGWSDLDVDNIVRSLNLEGSGWFAGLQHSENIYDSESHLVALSAGILWRSMEDQYSAYGYKLQQREATILPISLALSYTGKKPDFLGGRNFATIQGVYNIASTGDKLSDMWTGAEEHYKILRWQLARLQPIFGFRQADSDQSLHQWMLFLKLEGQWTNDNLIPVEKLSLGGYNTMRGYRTRGYLGDYGIYGTAELRTPILVNAISSLFTDESEVKPLDRFQFLGFIDYAWTCFNDLPSGYDDNEFLYSAGVGVRMALTKYMQLKCDVAFPLRDSYGDDDSMEFYLSVQMQF